MKILIEKAVIEQALEALEQWKEHDAWHKRNDWNDEDESAITALREALAEQAEKEPVAWMNDSTPMGVFARHKEGAENFGCTIPLYAAPVRTKDLTDDDIFKTNKTELPDCQDLVDYARAVIAADREKNR